MPLTRVQVVCPPECAAPVLEVLLHDDGVTNVVVLDGAARRPAGDLVSADVARERVDAVLDRLRGTGVLAAGSITVAEVETALGAVVEEAERRAPGEGADAVVWDQLVARTGQDASLTWSYVAFMVMATLLVSIGVVTDSTVAVIGGMVVGPEFGPLAAIAVGLLLHRRLMVRRAVIALVVGFAAAIAASVLATAVWRLVGLASADSLSGHPATEFIYNLSWFSLITALIAGAVGMLSLTSRQSAALVGVFISVTTIPAAGYAAVALVLGEYGRAGKSSAQLAINIVGIVGAAYLTIWLRRRRAVTDRDVVTPAPR